MRTGVAAVSAGFLLAWAQGSLAVEQAATLDWSRRVELSTPVSGIVRKVAVRGGDRVRAGQALVELDSRSAAAQMKHSKAAVQRSDEARREAEREWERAQELYDRTVLSDHELQLARIGFVAAEAQHQEAEAALEQAKLEMEYSTVRAPFDGVIIRVAVDVGETVVSRLQVTPLVVMGATGRFVARTELPWSRAAQMRVGQSVDVSVDGKRYPGEVASIGLEAAGTQGQERLFELVVRFETEPGAIYRRGQPAVLHLP